jgi:hypothetical protein
MAVILNASTSSGLVQTADTSGELVLQNNGTTRLTVNASGVTIPSLTATTVQGTIVQGTAVASTSGTSIDFTSIPSWVKRVTVMFNGVSTNGSSLPIVQLGDSGGVETSGYNGYYFLNSSFRGATSSGVVLNAATGSAAVNYGQLVFCLLDTNNSWSFSTVTTDGGSALGSTQCCGTKQLSATLDRIRITTVNGTDTFDAGTINIQYEG